MRDDREPTGAEMLAVLKADIEAANVKKQEDECRPNKDRDKVAKAAPRPAGQSEPNSAATASDVDAVIGCLLVPGTYGLAAHMDLTGFRKVACSRANGAAGRPDGIVTGSLPWNYPA